MTKNKSWGKLCTDLKEKNKINTVLASTSSSKHQFSYAMQIYRFRYFSYRLLNQTNCGDRELKIPRHQITSYQHLFTQPRFECLCKFPNTTRLCPQCTGLSLPSAETNPPFNLFSTPLQGQCFIDPSFFGVHWSFSRSLSLFVFFPPPLDGESRVRASELIFQHLPVDLLTR